MLSSLSMVKALTPKAWGSLLGTKRGRAQNLTGQSTTEHITRASASLDEELEALRRHRRQTEAWTLDSRNESDRVRQLWELADIAHLRLSSMSEQEKAAVLDLLDVRVRVLDHGKRLIPPRITIEGTVFYELLTEQMSGDLVSAGPPVLAPLRR